MKKGSIYKRCYSKQWEKMFPVKSVESNKRAFYCIPCGRKFACGANGIGNVRKHCESVRHCQNVSPHTSETEYRESPLGLPPQSLVVAEVDEDIPRNLNLTVSMTNDNHSGHFSEQIFTNDSDATKLPDVFETRDQQTKELENNTVLDDVNVVALVEKSNKVYDCEQNMEIYRNIHPELNWIKEGKF
ncbi:hypothetical protein RF11_04569 [Thelohanellus kitauei]|uniref:Uncharacterized protein n=1 Tax=Thelohanellus kitauei TaxID=669202 RepID=A0A0C2MA71_THEKT|nr:hypothetical protein RF11_04569 [Thelohanellus kitauei]